MRQTQTLRDDAVPNANAVHPQRRRSLGRRLMPLGVFSMAVAAIIAAVGLPGGSSAAADAPVTVPQVIHTYPHDRNSFCQGLVIHRGMIVEGTGLYEQSQLRVVQLETGRPTAELPLSRDVFGEGVTVWKDQILQLTWKNGYLIVYDANTLKRLGIVKYEQIDPSLREGWGITHDGKHLILSDGSSQLRFIDPQTWRLVRTLTVKQGFRSLNKLNELEYVDGQIFANVWYSDRIARIDAETGKVIGWLDLAKIRPAEVRRNREAVLNGIAWDADQRRLFVTGKNWPSLFEIQLP
jgi:glutaminyl-peptide cyclotransferase